MVTKDLADRGHALLGNKHLVLVVAMVALCAGMFWLGSRYPQLQQKAMMGAATHIDGLSFDTLVDIPENASVWWQIAGNSVNWMYTNRKGMGFGLVFGALLMTLLPFFGNLRFRSRTANSLYGVMLGSPLGLCVNCSTPVAYGLYASGARVETMLAAMISSPTLNIIVISMLFALLPTWLAILKLGVTIAFLLVGIPLLTRWALHASGADRARLDQYSAAKPANLPFGTQSGCVPMPARTDGWGRALIWVVSRFSANLWFVVQRALPLMALAGILGAAVVTFVPLESLIDAIPGGRAAAIATMLMVGLIGIVLPVPMGFDVIVTAVLLQAGLPMKYAVVLLVTLGIFSIYPFLMIWRDVSRRLALGLLFGLAGLGVVAGGLGAKYYRWDYQRRVDFVSREFLDSGRQYRETLIDRAGQGRAGADLVPELQETAQAWTPVYSGAGLSIETLPFNPRPVQGTQWFARVEGPHLGIDEPDNFSRAKLDFLYGWGHGIAAGDVHNDGWTDLVIASDSGLALYANRHGKFVRQQIDIPELNNVFVSNAALVDLNDDGWLDLYFSTIRKGNFVIHNQRGQFLKQNLHKLPTTGAGHTASVAFGDVDRNGRLDLVLGNAAGCIAEFSGEVDASCEGSRSSLLKQTRSGRFDLEQLPGLNGSTLSVLLSDFNRDGWLDLIVGNDFSVPDMYYLANRGGGFRVLGKSDGLIEKTTQNTMSIITADIDNDLEPEIYLGGIELPDTPTSARSRRSAVATACREFSSQRDRDSCVRFNAVSAVIDGTSGNRDVFGCLNLTQAEDRDICMALKTMDLAKEGSSESLCDRLAAGWEFLAFSCRRRFAPSVRSGKKAAAEAISQQESGNILLRKTSGGRYIDAAASLSVASGGWTWNAKFSDLNNDGWQDLYVSSGYLLEGNVSDSRKNFLYRNDQGKRFVDEARPAGIESGIPAHSYVFVDINNTGQQDIVAVPSIGPIIAYLNQSRAGNAIDFELRDQRGNHFGIGSKITIAYGDGRRQYREILASGGYQSFDAPIAHFGLGDVRNIRRVEIEWSTGERSVIEKELSAGARYRITRGR